jgi:hypothetical protein
MSAPRPWAFTRRRDGRFGSDVPHLDGRCGDPECQAWGGDELDGDGLRGIVWGLAFAALLWVILVVAFVVVS